MKPDTCDLLCLDISKAESLRTSRLSPLTVKRLAVLGKALADPTRVTVAIALRDGGELCVCDLAWVLERSDKLISHHLGVLKMAGLVTSRREGKMVMYALTESGRALLGAVAHDEEMLV
jgi:ArsR family transcriptional regulator, lead/cadmium/zinc/bismuth-responsive transcriptional repressor